MRSFKFDSPVTNYVTCQNQSELTFCFQPIRRRNVKRFPALDRVACSLALGTSCIALVRILIGSLHDLCGYDWPGMINRLSTFVLRTPVFFS